MTIRTLERCSVANEDCVVATLATCFACGNSVCLACSRRINWYRFRRVRVCDTCKEERNRLAQGG